ncbi:MAG: lipoyl synthase [Desulfuromonadales bacterium]|nr:lipoyl synthase [Desulfuromonadales bacterium]
MLSNHPALRAPLHRRGISQRKPVWLRKKINLAENREMEDLLKGLNLNTVCQQASCPNISECFSKKQATFLIMGKECTRKCTFCNISQEMPSPLDSGEPKRVAEAVIKLNLSHVVITSPTRDDLTDGGAAHFAITVDAIRSDSINTKIELLIPDFGGNIDSLKTVLSSQPDIIAHNIETVPRLYKIRNGADYKRSLDILRRSKTMAPEIPCKSGIMLGLGEKEDEIIDTIRDIAETGCDYLSIGQYLPPSKAHTPVMEFITPAKFAEFKGKAMTLGFEHVESAPYVRSSYHAKQYGKADN